MCHSTASVTSLYYFLVVNYSTNKKTCKDLENQRQCNIFNLHGLKKF